MLILLLVGILRSYAQYYQVTCVPGSTVYVPQLSQCYNSDTQCPGNVFNGNQYWRNGIMSTTAGDVKFCTNYDIDYCTPNCFKCKSYGYDKCLVCAGGSTRTRITRTPEQVMSLLEESCPCEAEYSETIPQTAECVLLCITNCQTCQNTSTCTTCNSGYYLNAQSTCSICVDPCLTCQSSTECLSCVGSNISLSGTQCQCNSGYYWNSSVCSLCIISCLTCITTSSQCTSCSEGYYLASNQCLPCDSNCQTCSGTANNCLNCPSGLFKILNNNECICQNGYYGTTVCAQCDSRCATCWNSPIYCLSCSDINSTLSNNQCPCNSGYYLNGTSCQSCQWPCSSCQTTSLTCLTCSDSNRHIQGTTCICNNGYYLSSNQCLQCQYPCQSCQTSANICLSCSDPISTSNFGYYLQSQQCLQCQFPCQTCTSDSICLTCLDSNSQLDGTTCKCNDGFYLTGNLCLQCSSDCKNCISLGSCLSCQVGYYQVGDQCFQCQYPCQTCLSESICLSCFNDLEGQQREYYYLENTQCHACRPPCQLCSSETYCLTCIDADYLQINKGRCICEQGYYIENLKCLNCPPLCSSCSSEDKCQTCISNAILDTESMCQCQVGFFYKDYTCQKCSRKCQKCENQFDNCTKCDEQSKLILRNGQCECKPGYYYQTLFDRCQECNLGSQNRSCLTKQITNSTFCDDGNQISRDGCSNSQIDQNYQCFKLFNQLDLCLELPPNCQQIEKQNQCLQCSDGYFLDQRLCLQCSDLCLTCNTKFQCKTCRYQIDRVTQQCIYCNQGYYFDNSQCNPLCGDGIKTDEEQCDDGNLLDNDGCNKNCQIVEGFECAATNSLSYCTKLNYPIPTIEIVQQAIKSPDRIFLKIFYQQKMQVTNLQINKDLAFNIENLDQEYYFVSINTIDAEIQLKQSLLEKTKMAIRFNTNQFRTLKNLTQQQQVYDIELPQFQVITQTQKQVTEIQGQVKDIVIISAGTIVLVSFLLGGLQLLLDFIDLIQLLSYLSYINTQFPYNYQQFMSVLQYAQIGQLFNLFDISFINSLRSKLDSLQGGNLVIGYVPIKMQLDGYKPQILINIPSILVVWFKLLIQYIISLITLSLINKFQLNHSKFRSKTSIKLFSMKIKQSLIKQNSQNVNLFFYSSIYKSIMATSYDTFFFISLSLANFTLQVQSLEIFLNQSLTLLIIIIYLGIIYYAWYIISSRNLNGSYYKQKFGSLIEGLRIKNSSRYYNLWQILKKGIFMYSLVNLYQDALFQIIVLLFLNVLDLVYLVNYKVYLDKIDYFRTISTQFQMLLHQMVIAILVLDDFLSIFTPYYKEFMGWFLIANIQLLMIKQLFIYIYTQRKLYIKFFQLIKNFVDWLLKKLLKEDLKSRNRIQQSKLQNNRVKRLPLQQLPF